MYAVRKGWPLHTLHVDASFKQYGPKSAIARTLRFEGDPDDAQRARLADIAERTPVTWTLKQGLAITTKVE